MIYCVMCSELYGDVIHVLQEIKYIPVSRCFIKDNQLFIDSHY